MRAILWVPIFALSAAAAPTTQPDDGVADILSQATAAPATQPDRVGPPTSQPAPPFADKKEAARIGAIQTSDGETIRGPIRHTAGKPFRVWLEKDGEFRDVPFAMIKHIDAKILWERDEKEWHFKESGSDIKEYSGKTYPARELQYTLTLINGQTLTGGVVEPLYLQTPDGPVTFALHKRDKGEVGQTLKQLVYVRSVEWSEEGGEAGTQARREEGTK